MNTETKNRTWTNLLLAVVMIVIAGVAITFAETMKVDVATMNGDEVRVTINGEAQVVNLEDIADGEERTFGEGDHQVVVKRSGDQLTVTAGGKEIACAKGGECAKKMVMISADGERTETGPHAIWIAKKMIGGDDDEEITVHIDDLDLEHLDNLEILQDLNIEVDGEAMVMRIDGGHHSLPMLKHIHEGDSDSLRYRCPSDDTELTIDKEQATQESYLCAVCGREMEKVEAKEFRTITIVHSDEEDD